MLVLFDGSGKMMSLGSGFFVNPSDIATNAHVIDGATSGYAKIVDGDVQYVIDSVVALDVDRH